MSIHKTAIIHSGAKIAKDVVIGPYSVIGKGVTLSKGVKIANHCVVEQYYIKALTLHSPTHPIKTFLARQRKVLIGFSN